MEGFGEFAIGLSGEGTAATDKAEGKEIHMAGLRYEDTRPGAWDPVERLKDQDLDGIRAEVMYPGVFGLWCYNASDADLHIEIVRVYNDWIAEFSASTPDRLVGVGILPMRGSTESKIAEVERVAKLGLKSVMLPLEVEGGYVNMEGGDQLWAALQDVGLPLGFHVGSSTKSVSADKYRSLGVGVAVIEQKICAVARGLTDLILSGVPSPSPASGSSWPRVASAGYLQSCVSMTTGGKTTDTGWSPSWKRRRAATSSASSGQLLKTTAPAS